MRKSIDEIREIVNKLVKKAGTYDSFKIAKFLDIDVLVMPLGKRDGYWAQDGRENVIVINENLSCERQQLVCAHELGHAVMHKELGGSLMRAYTKLSLRHHEIEANFFSFSLVFKNFVGGELIENVLAEYALKKEEIQLMYEYLEGQRSLDDYHTW